MKKIGIYVFGVFTGIIVSLIGLFILFHYFVSTARPVDPSKSVQKALKVNKGQMAVLDFANGTALIDFSSFGDQEAEYRWRYREKASGIETTGNGRVFEKYEKMLWSSFFKKPAGQLFIYAGQVRVEWSWGGTDSAWLYYQSDRTKTEVLNDNDFQTLDLSKIEL
jgi:hypothetical protein